MNYQPPPFHIGEKQYLRIINNTLDAILIFDKQGVIISVNPAATALFSYQEKELLGKNLALLRFSASTDTGCKPGNDLVVEALPCPLTQSCDLTGVDVQGKILNLRLRFITLDSDNDSVVFCLIIQNPAITLENQSRTEQLEKARDRAEQANKAKSYFLANMSHELRTPLHGIISFANMGFRRAEKMTIEKIINYFELIGHSGERLLHLLNSLLDLSKIDADGMDLEIAYCDLKHLIDTCLLEQSHAIQAKGLSVDFDIETDNTKIQCDKYRIGQVITNLLSNAIKFSYPDQCISIQLLNGQLKSDNDAIKFTIYNKGQAIPDGEHQSIFERFSQSSHEVSGTKGAGLGLTISREIINLHGGFMFARTELRDGACFEFLLPIKVQK